jgi:hypothetical protein
MARLQELLNNLFPYSPLKVDRHFGVTFCLHLQGRRSQATNQSGSLLTTCFTLLSCLDFSSILKTEATSSPLTSVDCQRTTQHYIPENRDCYENLAFYTACSVLSSRFCNLFNDAITNEKIWGWMDRLCGLVVRVPGYRSVGLGSIPGTTRKKRSGSGTGSTQPREHN